jgi:hypothetical protein
MKTIITFIFALTLFIGNKTNAQSQNHATIENVKVSYGSSTTGTAGIAQIQAIPNATITLKEGHNSASVYFKIKNKTTNAVIYEVNYSLNASPVTNETGKVLFQNNNGVILISSGTAIILTPYIYEIYTKDTNQNPTSTFSIVQ